MINAILPGVHVETVAGERKKDTRTVGVVTMPLELDWGDEVITLTRGENTLVKLGYKLSDVKLKLVKEAMYYANKLIIYRTNSGDKAQATLATNVTFEALFGGERGNDIKIIVSESDTQFIVKTFVGIEEIDKQIVKTPADFKPNGFVKITGAGTFEEKTVSLSGGTSQKTASIDDYFIEIEKHDYNVMAYPYDTVANITKVIDFVKAQRDNGVFVSCVISGNNADDRGVINNTIGGKTLNYTLTPQEACATMAGIQAKCGIDNSATYFEVIGWIDVNPRLNQIQMETKVQAGEILFVVKYGKVMVLYDINSLTTFTEQNPKDFSKNLVVRTLDSYAMQLERLLDTKAIGKIRNSLEGRNQIKGMIVDMTVGDYLNNGYLEGFTADDVAVLEGLERDSVVATVGIKIIDTVDKIYITVTAL